MIYIYNYLTNKRKLAQWTVFWGWAVWGCSNSTIAQDVHFSQFYTTPMFTNPGNTGIPGQGVRFANNYRNQWSKLGIPYKTFYSSIDGKVKIARQLFGIGGLIVHDKTTHYDVSTDEVFISLSYTKIIDNQQFTIGIQPGFAFKSYNLNGLTFGNQFDAANEFYNTSLSSSESSLADNLSFFDMNVGLYWRTLIRNAMPSAGFSVSHIFRPNAAFSSSTTTYRLPMKFSFNSQLMIPMSEKLELTPSVLYTYTVGANELLLGGTEGRPINDARVPVRKIYIINMLRINPFKDVDAFIIGGGIRFSKFDIGMTYDFNISPLYKASNFNGAFEISLVFIGDNHSGRKVKEPCYIY